MIHLNKQTLEDGLDLLEGVRGSGKPLVCTIHITQTSQSLGAAGGRLRDFIAIRSLRRAKDASWAAVSDGRASGLTGLLGLKIPVIYNAVSQPLDHKRAVIRKELLAVRGWPENSLLVVCLGRLVAQKNPERFLRMAASLFEIEQTSRFLWIGGGEEQSAFLDLAGRYGLAGVVDCTGWLLEPRRLLSGADLYLHPAVYEGLPLAILEAMAAGLPCVLSEEIASEMDVFDSEAVITAKEGDTAWLTMAASSAERTKYSTASARLFQSHFRTEVMAKAYLKFYALSMAGIRK